MKIYFSVSFSNLNDEIRQNSLRILENLEAMGHTVLNKEFFTEIKQPYHQQTEEESIKAQKKITKMKKSADIVMFEVSKPTVAIGQELNLALSLNKPVIALYANDTAPHILRDEGGDLLILSQYKPSTLPNVVKDAIDFAAENQEVRFNFFISPAIGNYLDWIASNKKIPRSVYLRNLILQDMKKNAEYND